MILMFYICHKLAKKLGITQWLKGLNKTLKRCMQATRPTSEAEDVEAESETGSLSDQLINPGEYQPVLPTTENTQLLSSQKTKSKSMKNRKG